MSEVVRSFVGGLPVFRRFPPAVIVAVGINTVNYISARKEAVSERASVERIGWNRVEKLRGEYFELTWQPPSIATEPFHGQGGGGELDASLGGGLAHNYFCK